MNCISFLILFAASAMAEEVFIGDLTTKVHGVKGSLYAVNESALLVKKFEYDGQGPDAFFWVGTEGSPSKDGVLLPHPFNGTFFGYEDPNAPILGAYDGTKDIVLTLPKEVKVSQLKWFSVWCRAFSVNFGDLIFPKDFNLEKVTFPDSTTSKDDLPPPLVHPDNAHDPESHDNWEDSDVKAEPEGEPEPHDGDKSKPRKGAASSIAASSGVVLLALLGAKYML